LVTIALDSFAIAYNQVGHDSAINLMLDFFNSRRGNLVDSAYLSENSTFFVKFHNSLGPHGIFFEPQPDDSLQRLNSLHRDSILYSEADLLKRNLANGNLVIIGERGGRVYLSNASNLIQKIDRTMSSNDLNPSEKLNALKDIVIELHHARKILQNWRNEVNQNKE
jgi:hypothetical protein